ncbi:hypothetical protein L3Q82_016948, partial [Scortum barcoo]
PRRRVREQAASTPRAMQPTAGRLQHDGGRPDTSGRKHYSSQRPQSRSTMTTEYQEKFLPPFCHTTVISTSKQKDPYHPLKSTYNDMTTFRSFYVTQKWIKPPQLSAPPKGHRRCTSAPHNTAHFVANQMISKVEDYTSVYKNDFRAWTVNKRQLFKLSDNLKVHEGLVVTSTSSKEGCAQENYAQVDSKAVPKARKLPPFESVTSYRSDYVTHPLQPRTRREKPAQQNNTGLSLEYQVPQKPKATWDINQQLTDEASELFKQFKTLKTKFHGQGKAKESGPPSDYDNFLSTTHADYTPHKCQRTKPVLPSMLNIEKSNEPFQATTTMKEDYKAWDIPRRLPAVQKGKLDWPKKTGFSVCTPKPAESCSPNPKPFSLQPKLDGTAACKPSCDASKKHQCPVENRTFSSFECISNGTKESKSYLTTSLERGATWPDGEEPSQTNHIISCMVSSKS